MKWILGFVFVLILTGMVTAETIPDFTLSGSGGIPFRMGKEIGKKIFVIDFWASWCKPCKTLLKRLQEIKNQDSEVEVIAISIDDASAQAMAANYIQGKRFDFIALFDAEGQVAKMLNPALQIPFTVIVNRRGEIVYSHAGYVSGIEKEIMAKIQACK